MYRKLYRKKVKGYMTVEAGFIISWVIFLFVFLLYACFYLYDKCVLFQDAYTLCFRGSVQKEEKEALAYVQAHMQEQFGGKYLGTDGVQGDAGKEGQEVIVSGTCGVKIPFGHFLTLAGNDGWHIRTEARARIMNPTRIIRCCRMAENALEGLWEQGK
ncbi:MAG: hypothetical protein NC341_12340 [Blautia sp.]|nr:hypothetical protein [Blautia sp.]MCM1199920.1 hypothetical protein [Bacteroides fragilis]